MIALVEICDECGTRYQSPALQPNAAALRNALKVLEMHLPAPGKRLHLVCPTCNPAAYRTCSPLEREVWDRARRRGRGEVLGELDANDFDEIVRSRSS
ncbi:MAG TPA: hypothetical protein VEB22_11325 [Phycisphaerales bacterium]|nr:hypothetical protein [Phycisphaerales bacterium]